MKDVWNVQVLNETKKFNILLTYRGFDKLISIGTGTDGESGRGGGVAPNNGDGGLAEGLALHPLRLVKDKG